MKKNKLPTFRELLAKEEKERGKRYVMGGRQNTFWDREITSKCEHKWIPVRMEDESNDGSLDKKVYLVCLKCCAWTYIIAGYVNYYLNSPDLLEDEN